MHLVRIGVGCCAIAAAMPLVLGAADKPATQGQTVSVSFDPAPEGSPLAPRFSPKGTQIALTPAAMPGLAGHDHLAGRLRLGPIAARGDGQLVVLARSERSKPYDLLFIDLDCNGSVADDKPLTTTASQNRGDWRSSFAAPELKVNHAAPDKPTVWESYPVNLWAVVEKPEEQPAILRFSRRGFLVGPAVANDAKLTLMVCDGDNDGVLKEGDWWGIRTAGSEQPFTIEHSRAIGDFAWAAGKAWKLELVGTSGRRGRLIEFDPGISEEEDAIRRDKLRDDRLAARAQTPIAFRKDVDEAIKAARAAGQPYFLEFEAEWCIPCKQMHTWVFTAKDVADAAAGILCITVDGDDRKDLVEQHSAKGYPHGILFSPDGTEISRFSGYQSVKEATAFFRKLDPRKTNAGSR